MFNPNARHVKKQAPLEPKILAFDTIHSWANWLAEHHGCEEGVWLRFYKKNSGVPTVTYAEALDEALCHGWIDGQVKRLDELSYLQRFTPRRAGSLWSKRNVEHVSRLTAAARMKEPGLKQVEAAKTDGRWDRAYHPPSTMEMSADFLTSLAKNKKAQKTFDQLNKANRYAIAWRLQTATKAETKQRRIKSLIRMLAQGKKLHN